VWRPPVVELSDKDEIDPISKRKGCDEEAQEAGCFWEGKIKGRKTKIRTGKDFLVKVFTDPCATILSVVYIAQLACSRPSVWFPPTYRLRIPC
jgi:hypothetical protein